MIKIISQIILVVTTLFSYEIRLDKPSIIQKTVKKAALKIPLVRDDEKEVVIDKSRGLMWQDNIDTKTIRKNRKDAKQYCRSLIFAGYDDWYLPRLKQLKSIIDETKHNPVIRDEFKNIVPSHYWSSSPNLSDTMNVLNIDFKNAQIYNTSRRGKAYVRCVRGKYIL